MGRPWKVVENEVVISSGSDGYKNDMEKKEEEERNKVAKSGRQNGGHQKELHKRLEMCREEEGKSKDVQ